MPVQQSTRLAVGWPSCPGARPARRQEGCQHLRPLRLALEWTSRLGTGPALQGSAPGAADGQRLQACAPDAGCGGTHAAAWGLAKQRLAQDHHGPASAASVHGWSLRWQPPAILCMVRDLHARSPAWRTSLPPFLLIVNLCHLMRQREFGAGQQRRPVQPAWRCVAASTALQAACLRSSGSGGRAWNGRLL